MKIKSILSIILVLIMCFFTVSCSVDETTTAAITDNEGNIVTSGDDEGNTATTGDNEGEDDGFLNVTGKIYIKFFKVGKANATLIRVNNEAVLIDAGEDDDGEKILEYMNEKAVTNLDYMILTQFNKNHVGSVGTILNNTDVTIDKVIEPAYEKTGTAYDTYRAAINNSSKVPTAVSEKMSFKLDGATFTIYPATTSYSGSDVDEYNSLVVTVKFGDFRCLFASDIIGDRITEVISDLNGQNFDVIQAPNHGVFDTNNETLFNAVKAEYAVIFASDKNPEDTRTIASLEAAGASTVLVTKLGSVELKCDGSADGITIKQ